MTQLILCAPYYVVLHKNKKTVKFKEKKRRFATKTNDFKNTVNQTKLFLPKETFLAQWLFITIFPVFEWDLIGLREAFFVDCMGGNAYADSLSADIFKWLEEGQKRLNK